MKVLLQRVSRAQVTVAQSVVGSIGNGLLAFVAIAKSDSQTQVEKLVAKTAELRIFAGGSSQFDRSILDVGGSCLVVSQFTLQGDARKGRRPSFSSAADPEPARVLIDRFADGLRHRGVPVETGEFGAHMIVELVNDGPVTILLED